MVAFCLRQFSADFIICMCAFDFRQAQVVGFIGFALQKNNAEPAENNLRQEAAPHEEPAERRNLLTEGLNEFCEERIDLPEAKEK